MKDLMLIKLALISCVWVFVGFIVGYASQQCVINYQNELLDAYSQYNKGTEQLLDDIDDKYDWVDSFDNDDYYQGRARIDSLMWGK